MSDEISISIIQEPQCQETPCCVEVEAGKRYFWCSCGKSQKEPYCDGSHKGTEMKSVSFIAETTEKVSLCRCKKTRNPPYCDGSHNQEL